MASDRKKAQFEEAADDPRPGQKAVPWAPKAESETTVSRPDWVTRTPRTWQSLAGLLMPDVPSTPKGTDEQEAALGVVFKEAYDEGIRAAKQTVGAIMERYHQAIAQLGVFRQQALTATEQDLATLAVRIANEVLLAEPDVCAEFTQRMAQEAITRLGEAERITLRVSGTDMCALREKHPDLIESGRIRIIEDPDINLGGVIAECEWGRLDASLEGRLAEVAKRFREAQTETGSNEDRAPDDTDRRAG